MGEAKDEVKRRALRCLGVSTALGYFRGGVETSALISVLRRTYLTSSGYFMSGFFTELVTSARMTTVSFPMIG